MIDKYAKGELKIRTRGKIGNTIHKIMGQRWRKNSVVGRGGSVKEVVKARTMYNLILIL